MNLATGLTGQVDGSVEESLQCTDFKESARGLAAKVAFTMETTTSEPALRATEPIRHKLNSIKHRLGPGEADTDYQEMQRRAWGKTAPGSRMYCRLLR
ncbi:hypothetical protein ACPOL_0017 [Acidisarcina polymorpha]|uniref:Uncharacterized protein n=1 Tax=Acidisarcina polymorpha TaxID=2211140 RepID=A0A2Z5FSF6_9BACT|nr:hypothetical protein [Acidisarcina polymorpha]AXC09404.1 hypothetical protein ACPOL_0017 [Acidisarcina polymorpha]